MSGEDSLQGSHPPTEFKIVRSADEKMEMIGHYHVSADSDAVISLCPLCELNEGVVNLVYRENWLPILYAARDEVYWLWGENIG